MRGRISTRLAPGLALLAAACGTAAGSQLADAKGPMAIVAFLGKTQANPGKVVPYLAVAASRGDELRIFDPRTDLVVRSPGVAFPLSVPTLTRPLLLAAAPLNDFVLDAVSGDPIPLPDVLLVAGPGHVVQLVSTWEEPTETDPSVGMRVVAEWDLSPWAGEGAEILSMVGAPVPGTVVAPSGTIPIAPPVPGRGRVLIGFSGSSDGLGGKLVVLDFERAPGGTGLVELSAPPWVQHLGFDPVALSLSPDAFHLYAATPDAITDTGGGRTVLGVGEVTMGTDAGVPWTVRGLATGTPTTLVASAILGERIEEVSPELGDPPFGPPVLRVYAALDPSACGPDRPINCGIATLDTGTAQLAADIAPPGGPVPTQAYRSPMLVPGVPLAIAVGMPPLLGPAQKLSQGPSSAYPSAVSQPLERLAPNTGTRWTTAVMAVATAAGPAYVLDLGRTWAPDDTSIIKTASTRTQVYTAFSSPSPLDANSARPALVKPNGTLATTDDDIKAAFVVTPGFTQTDTWEIVWQGPLPDLSARRAVISRPATGAPWLAIENDVSASPAAPAWVPGALIGDPRLGIHAGDIVVFKMDGVPADPACVPVSESTYWESLVADFLPPDATQYPGGALQLAAPPPPVGNPAYDPFCFVAPGETQPGSVTIVSGDWVLSGTHAGYAGRPQLGVTYRLAWQDEAPLLAACPLLQEPAPSPMPACDATCREACESLVLARKARRTDYPAEPACAGNFPGCFAGFPEMEDPLQAGPALKFKLGLTNIAGGSARAMFLSFATQSGINQMSRRPSILSQGTNATSFDKSRYPEKEGLGTVFYVTYLGDLVFEMPPGETLTSVSTIR